MDSEQILFDFTGKNICLSRFFRRQKFCGLPEGRSLRDALSVNGTQKKNTFSGATARFRVQRLFSPHSFLARQKRMGRRRHTAPSRRRKDMACGAADAAPHIAPSFRRIRNIPPEASRAIPAQKNLRGSGRNRAGRAEFAQSSKINT